MEATAGVPAGNVARGGYLPLLQPSRKEWRAVSEHQSVGNPGDEDLEQAKLGQPDERTIYEKGREPLDVDFCSITMDGTLDNEIFQQQIHNITRRREELQQMEIELRAQIIARSEIVEMQKGFDTQLKEHASASGKLQEQLCESKQAIQELERKIEEKDRELHAIKLDNEAAWAKQDLLREQNKELATFRRERDHSEAERTQHIKQIHDLQEHIQEKERQLMELQEQHRVAQETIIYKDEQLRDAQAWIGRAREMDVLQSNTNHTLQAELRQRTEQYNQLWLGCQRQFAEMERLHMHSIQHLQLELADAREQSGTYNDENSKTTISQFGPDNGNQFEVNGGSTSSGNAGVLLTENSDNGSSFALAGNTSNQTDHAAGVSIAPSSMLGMPSYLPSGQMTALHPIFMHQQGFPHSVASHVPQSHLGHFHSVPAMPSLQQWQNQQAVSAEGSQISMKDDSPSSQTDQNSIRSETKFNYEKNVNGEGPHPNFLDMHMNLGQESQSVISSSSVGGQAVDVGDLVASQSEHSLQQVTSQFHDTLRFNSLEPINGNKDLNVLTSTNHGPEGQVLSAEQTISVANASSSSDVIHSVHHNEMVINRSSPAAAPEGFSSTGQKNMLTAGNVLEDALLDERSLLACIVRTIPAGGRICISSMLPNRLSKMLAPLQWHDYKQKYGKLDEFVASHPELFVIDGNYIQLKEGAKKMVAATAAVAKVAAAAAASPYSSYLPTVAVTPVAQSYRLKKVPSVDSKNFKSDNSVTNDDSETVNHLVMNRQSNLMAFSVTVGLLNVKTLNKSKDYQEIDGPENIPAQSSVHVGVGNGVNLDRSSTTISKSRGGPVNGMLNSHFVGKHQNRTSGSAYVSRR